ncbi:MAG: methyltransferase domain-containing protein [Chlamydiales bacterium]|nr:methyltransferase domain-containing protein [Chlamydiales bacterium]
MNRFTTFLWVRYFNSKDLLTTMCRYWTNPKFALIDSTLLLSYFFKSPYSIGREHNDAEPYGETPLATLDQIIKHCPIKPDDTVIELGSGRGRTCFWLSVYKGYKTIGIEYIPAFVLRAQKFAKFFGVSNVEFRLGDMLEADLSDADWIYLFGTALPDESIIRLCKKLEILKPGTKIITVSYPLTAYSQCPKFEVTQSFDAEFSWGTTQVYIHEM